MQRPYLVVDAFAYEPFTGNPAAVVLDARGLDDAAMARIAAEFNLSETTFITPEPDRASPHTSVRFRWFTPTVEVDMCGHATIAGLHAMAEAGRIEQPKEDAATVVRIHARCGLLTGFVEAIPNQPGKQMIWLEMIPPTLGEFALARAELAEALRVSADVFDGSLPPVKTQDRDAIVFVRDVATLNSVQPDFGRLGAILAADGLRGLCLSTVRTITPAYHVQSRFFAPPAGINEDPVTGSVHGPLAVHLAQQGRAAFHDGVAALNCGQAKPGGRGGLLHALVVERSDGSHGVRIGGRAFSTMRGELLA
jgi:PhzF family phenazine biosynthesis protein